MKALIKHLGCRCWTDCFYRFLHLPVILGQESPNIHPLFTSAHTHTRTSVSTKNHPWRGFLAEPAQPVQRWFHPHTRQWVWVRFWLCNDVKVSVRVWVCVCVCVWVIMGQVLWACLCVVSSTCPGSCCLRVGVTCVMRGYPNPCLSVFPYSLPRSPTEVSHIFHHLSFRRSLIHPMFWSFS